MALSLLRPGPDTLACRLYRERPESLAAFAARLPGDPSEVDARVRDARLRARRLLDLARDRGLRPCPLAAPAYPTQLASIVDPPLVLWQKGHLPAAAWNRCVALVGSRQATPTGLTMARTLGRHLADAGWTVVSGMALGIDGAAHAGALQAAGHTVAVLGCGADIVYPPSHAALASAIVKQGMVLSEFPPGMAPRPWHFPLRNRIISGLSQAVVVVEASRKSGSLITARLAMEQGRDVLAVPGSAISGRYQGCHALIRDGARLVETVDDILDELDGVSRARRAPDPDGRPRTCDISELERAMAIGESYGLDDLARATGRSTAALLAELGALEVRGRISRVGGGHFVRLDAAASVR